ncbi:hypothetical protein C8Q80DRAFT_617615 [Daedaleopsis nitida]|nr:hypothetical protein C8Q80DRAFT_617615 [Daedaleopsis nitida]
MMQMIRRSALALRRPHRALLRRSEVPYDGVSLHRGRIKSCHQPSELASLVTMHFSTILTIAGVALSTVLGVAADPKATTIWVPSATVVETNTFTGTRIEQVWTTVPPYEWETTFPITWTATQTMTKFRPVVTNVPERRHARDFDMS